jgi:hypothetical protein
VCRHRCESIDEVLESLKSSKVSICFDGCESIVVAICFDGCESIDEVFKAIDSFEGFRRWQGQRRLRVDRSTKS